MKNKRKSRISPQQKNKALTKQLFINASIAMIRKGGIKSLGVNKISEAAGRSKRMLYDYFGDLDGLLDELFQQTDNWFSYDINGNDMIEENKENSGKQLASSLLKDHFVSLLNDSLLQDLRLLELTRDDEFLSNIAAGRELVGDKLFSITKDHFINTNVDIRMIHGLISGGINYMVLHNRSTKSEFCGIDLKNEEHQENILKTIDQLMGWAYKKVVKS